MENINGLGVQELSFGEQRVVVGGDPGRARKIGIAIGAFGGWARRTFASLDDWVWDFAEGFVDGFENELLYGG